MLERVVVLLQEHCLEEERDLHAALKHKHEAQRDLRVAGRGALIAHEAL